MKRTVYVTYTSATLRREGGVISVNSEGKRVSQIWLHDLGQIVLMGNVVLTPGALDLLVDQGVDTVFLSHHGRYRGRIVHSLSGNVRLRLAQYEKLTDSGQALAVARAIVAGKIANMRTMLLRFARRNGPSDRQKLSATAMRASIARVAIATTLDEARGCEGSATHAYFRCFQDAILAEGFRFDGRNRRPPLDPVNALLSLGYTLLANVVEAAVNVVGLDPYVGSLHAVETGRPSLVCDLEEEFRAPVVDAVVVAAINKHVLQVDDFEDAGPGEPVVIKREAVSRFVGLVERRFRSDVLYDPIGQRIAWRQVVEHQARAFARFVLGDAPVYEPLVAR